MMRSPWSLRAIGFASLALLAMIGCGKKQQPELEQSLAREQYDEAMSQLEDAKLGSAVKSLGEINQYSSGDRARLEPMVRIGMADATFFQGNDIALIDARTMYLDFVTLYGDHPMAPYAQFQAGICSLRQVIHASRDQSQTMAALDDLREVSERYSTSRWSTAARMMVRQAEEALAEHEIIVGKFYKKRKKWQAAEARFRKALELYPDYEGKDRVYFYLAEVLLRRDNTDEGRIYLDKLVKDYPEGKYVKQARKALDASGGELGLEFDGTH